MKPVAYIHGLSLNYGGEDESALLRRCRPDLAPACLLSAGLDLKQALPGVNLRRASPMVRKALAAACRALHAGGVATPVPAADAPGLGLYIGTSYGDSGACFAFLNTIIDDGAHLASPTLFSHSVSNVFCGMLSILLNIQGPCCTVSQFGLSFAGALQAAMGDLACGRLAWALVGAVEERSPELDLLYAGGKEQAGTVSGGKPPEQDCAVFFLLGSQAPDDRKSLGLSLSWRGLNPHPFEAGAEEFSSSYEEKPYVAHPAGQALDTALAAMALCASPGSGVSRCSHYESRWGRGADILVITGR